MNLDYTFFPKVLLVHFQFLENLKTWAIDVYCAENIILFSSFIEKIETSKDKWPD